MDLYIIRKKLSIGIPLTQIPLRVTDYSRVSTDHIEQQKSLKNQIDHFNEMIKNNKNWTYIEGYVDNGISGTTDYKRDNFMKMINDAKNDKFDLIITKEISRFSRNTLDSIKYTRILLSYGVAVLFINDNINTIMPDSEFRLTIMASMAQDEIRRLSERVKFGMNRAILNGTILGNNMLYGYKKDKLTGNLIIVEKEANIIKKLFCLYTINNYSLTKIANIFNKENKNKKWYVSTLTRIIKNPKYKGYYCGKKTESIDYMTQKIRKIPKKDWITYKDNIRIPPIIKESLWNKANKRLNIRNKNFGLDYKLDKTMYQNRYPLSAKIYCANDNQVFRRRKQSKSDITWICAKHLTEGKETCNTPFLRESEIYLILNDVFNILKIKNKKIDSLLQKIIVSKLNHQENLKLDIFLNTSHKNNINKTYEFKRGYNTTRTKRYIIKYQVSIH